MENINLYKKFKDLTQADLDEEFFKACKKGDFNTVKYLLTSPELKQHADIHALGGVGIKWTCSRNHLELVKYLLTSPELKEHADIHADDDYGFKTACSKGHLEVIQFLIFDMNIEKNDGISQYLKNTSNKKVENMFDLRELNQKLEANLNINQANSKRVKV